MTYTQNASVVVMHQTCIREVPGLNLDRITYFPGRIYCFPVFSGQWRDISIKYTTPTSFQIILYSSFM